jgi:hypothetical protein
MNVTRAFDLIDVLSLIKRKQRRYLALLLNDVEELMFEEPEMYIHIRKVLLDYFNDYTRSIFRILMGDDIEGSHFR